MKKREKKTDRIWQAGLMTALLLLLCSCTRKEELLFLSEEGKGQTAVSEGEGEVLPTEGEGLGISTGESESSERHSAAGLVPEDSVTAQPCVIYVHVCGAVAHPGVYELEAGSRVYEAVEQAGGFAESADQNYVNQAQTLEDGVMLMIPTREETAAARERETAAMAGQMSNRAEGLGIVGGVSQGGQEGDTAGTSDGRININTASEAQLCEIPGVGATRAAAIAAYRESHGAFEKPEDIMKVNGIKEGMYEKIKESISVK